jgi:ferritin-like protein
VKDRKSSDFLETLVPHNELERLVYSYYQALNAQVLGNEEKVQEHFLLLSKLNDDFYYVREAKEFLDERFQELQENYDELTDSIVHEHLKNDGGSDVRSQ